MNGLTAGPWPVFSEHCLLWPNLVLVYAGLLLMDLMIHQCKTRTAGVVAAEMGLRTSAGAVKLVTFCRRIRVD